MKPRNIENSRSGNFNSALKKKTKNKQGSSTPSSETGKHVHLFIFTPSFGVYLPGAFLSRIENSNL